MDSSSIEKKHLLKLVDNIYVKSVHLQLMTILNKLLLLDHLNVFIIIVRWRR